MKGVTHMHFMDGVNIWCFYLARMSPALNRSSVIQCFQHSNEIEIRDKVLTSIYIRQSQTFFKGARFVCCPQEQNDVTHLRLTFNASQSSAMFLVLCSFNRYGVQRTSHSRTQNCIAAKRKKRKGGMIRRTVHLVRTEDVGGKNKTQLSN